MIEMVFSRFFSFRIYVLSSVMCFLTVVVFSVYAQTSCII